MRTGEAVGARHALSSDVALTADRIRISILSAPLSDVVPMSFSSLRDRRTCLVEIEAGGETGVGESWINYPSWSHNERLATLREGVVPLISGRDISDPVAVFNELVTALEPVGRQWGAIGPVMQAISAVDLALWDLRGKLSGLPVAEMLSGHAPRESVPAYGSGVGPDAVASWCEAAHEQGLRAVKVKLGFGAERDASTVEAARSALGASATVFGDANQAWSLDESLRMVRMLESHRLEWIEEPLAGDALDDLAALAAATSIPIATGENVYGLATFERYVRSGAVGVIQPDLTKCGGISATYAVAAVAQEQNVAVAPHCYGGAVGIAASLHLASAFPQASWMEFDVRPNPLRSELLATPLAISNGELLVPMGPGFGIELDRGMIRHHLIDEWEYSA